MRKIGRARGALMNIVASILAASAASAAAVSPAESGYRFDLPEQSLADSLRAVGSLAGVNVAFDPAAVNTLRAPQLQGSFSAEQALSRLVQGTRLIIRMTAAGSFVIEDRDAASSSAKSSAAHWRNVDTQGTPSGPVQSRPTTVTTPDESAELAASGIPEILVKGARILNMDVVRTRDDPQPYQILDSAAISQSSSVNVEDFLKRALTANTLGRTNSQMNATASGSASSINLRGLGTASTLILINGRRAVGASSFGANIQPDLNAIPLAAIERIEVLPAAASAIYGGAAMGGVVNVVLKQNYEGGDARVRYENTFDADAPIRDIDLTYGATFEEGRTNVLFAAHYSDTKWLVNADRPELMQAGVQRVLQNAPALLYSATNPFRVGTTPNISSVNGSNLTLRDGTPLNSPFTHIPAGYGAGSNPLGLVANAGTYNLELPYTTDNTVGLARPLGSAPRVKSFMAVARRDMTEKLHVFSEFAVSENYSKAIFNPLFSNYTVPASAPTNPFQQSVRVNIPDARLNLAYESEYTSRRAVLGFIYDLPAGWRVEADYTWNSIDNLLLAQFIRINNALATGAVNPFVDTVAFPLAVDPYIGNQRGEPYFEATSYLRDVGVRFVGMLGELPAGRPVVTVGLGYRKEGMDSGRFTSISPGALPSENFDNIYFPQSQDVMSFYTEGLVPLVSRANRIPGVHELDLQLAVRSERYSVDSGTAFAAAGSGVQPVYTNVDYTSTNTTIGLRYAIVDGVTVRASFSSAFLPPSYSQLLPGVQVTTAPVQILDPRRGNALTFAPVIQGGNPDLEPQSADNWNLGLVLEPAFVPGLRVSADWFRVEQDNVIVSPTVLQIVNNESSFPSRVERGPVAPGDPYGVGEIIRVNQSLINGTRAQIEGWDLGLGYRFDTDRHGRFQFNSAATLFSDYKVQNAINTPLLDKVNKVADNGPLRFKLNASLVWDLRNWNAGWSTYYFGSYDQYDVGTNLYVLAQGSRSVPSQIYHDLFVGYRFDEAGANQTGVADLLSDVSVQLGVRNVFDDAPPFDAFYQNPAYYSPFGDPRMRSYSLTVSKAF